MTMAEEITLLWFLILCAAVGFGALAGWWMGE